mmetsp:Transcript_51030/g.89066  ORF Transcript_51030/g.89066 Transcript_51030/m.89066 type:complete len:344 (+) Transcript_51030:54-1085(+)
MASGTGILAAAHRTSLNLARAGSKVVSDRKESKGSTAGHRHVSRGPSKERNATQRSSPELSAGAPRAMLAGTHWTENPMAMEMMRGMTVDHMVPLLQPRLTQFHGTRVPVFILFFLPPTEVGRLGMLDKFWQRIVAHPLVWQGLYCRDYGRGCQRSLRCVWHTLDGRKGAERCLCHLGTTHPSAFADICRQITAIPGRSKEELMQAYVEWRKERARVREELYPTEEARSRASSVKTGSAAGHLTPEDAAGTGAKNGSAVISFANAGSKQPWNLRAHCTFALPLSHNRDLVACPGAQTSREKLRTKPLCPILPPTSARESRTGPPGRPYGAKGIKVIGLDTATK